MVTSFIGGGQDSDDATVGDPAHVEGLQLRLYASTSWLEASSVSAFSLDVERSSLVELCCCYDHGVCDQDNLAPPLNLSKYSHRHVLIDQFYLSLPMAVYICSASNRSMVVIYL